MSGIPAGIRRAGEDEARKVLLMKLAHENIRAKMEALDLWHHIRNVHIIEQDRLYATAGLTLPIALARCPRMTQSLVSKAHHEIFRVFPHGPAPLSSYRENARPSLQVTFFVVLDRDEHGREIENMGTCYCDLDIDLGNPARDLVGAFIHWAEVLWPGKTDPVKVREQLRGDPRVAARLEEIEREGWVS